MEQIEFLPFSIEIKQIIFSYMRNIEAYLLINAHFTNRLFLKHVRKHKTKEFIWNELRPSLLESNIYGSGMYIVRSNINIAERLLLFN